MLVWNTVQYKIKEMKRCGVQEDCYEVRTGFRWVRHLGRSVSTMIGLWDGRPEFNSR